MSRTQHAVFLVLALHFVFPALWLVVLFQQGPRPNDWLHLKIVADHFVAGDWAHLYSTGADAINPGYFWRYPPFALYLVAPLAWVPRGAAYALVAGTQVAALIASLILLARLAPPLPGTTHVWALAVALSAPAISTVIAGQNSALILLCVAGAATLWTRGRTVAACALLGLLAVKPNWGVFFGFFAIATRQWGGAAAMLGVALGLCAAAVPLGWPLWRDFFAISASHDALLVGYEPYKVITLGGFLNAAVGPGLAARALWLAAGVALGAMTVLAWQRQGSAVGHLGLVLLLVLVINPYASFYDGLVLAVPASVWWSERDRWRTGAWRLVGALIAVAWCGEQYLYSWANVLERVGVQWVPAFSLVGPVAAAWLAIAAREALASDRPPGGLR